MEHKRSLISIAMATIMLFSLCAVCVSVSAANGGSSSGSVTASSNVVGNPIPADTSPSLCILNGGDDYYLFAQGYDGALWCNHRDNLAYNQNHNIPNWGWEGWKSLGGYLTASPAAVSGYASSRIDVFVRGGGGALWSRYTTDAGGSWSNWREIGGQLLYGTGPTAYAWANNRIGWLVTGTDGALYHMWADSAGTHGWENLGGYLTASPGATSLGSGSISVFVRGGGGALWQKSYNNGWGSWTPLGGYIAPGTGPAASVWRTKLDMSSPTDRIDVFVTGTSGAMWQKTWTAASGWTNWVNRGGQLTSSPTVAMEKYCMEVFARFTDGFIRLNEYCNGAWTGFPTGGSMQGPPGVL